MNLKILIFISFLFFGLISESIADTVYLKNGRNMDGLIKKENEKIVELDVGFGTIKFSKHEIDSIKRSDPVESGAIRKEWERRKKTEEEERVKREHELEEANRREEFEPKEVEFSNRKDHIIVEAMLNEKVKASLLLDTGASTLVLSSPIAKKLGIKTRSSNDKNMVEVQVADGRKIDARYIILDSVRVQDIEARDVGAIVLLDAEDSIEDGLLGMSFLNRFNFQIDTVDKKLILQKRE
ncbi:TIGR02281 family clan AA aspartic protease [Candidatus Omnitrophota bacterium]